QDDVRHRRWARRVGDVMTTTVVTVDRYTSYQEIDRLLTERRISGVPVLKMGRQVAGVVSEADLLAAEDETARQARPPLATAQAAAREPDRRHADDLARHHHRAGRDHPRRGPPDEHPPRQE